MAVVLFRVDERLIHGQVVVGWGTRLHPDRILVVDDEIARSDWEQELYSLGLPPEIDVGFFDVEEARRRVVEWQGEGHRTIVLTRDVKTMAKLAADGRMRGERVNIGGIHYAPGRRSALPYVFLSAAEETELERLEGEGVEIEARDLPDTRAVTLDELIGREGRGA